MSVAAKTISGTFHYNEEYNLSYLSRQYNFILTSALIPWTMALKHCRLTDD